MTKQTIALVVNGDHYEVAIDPWRTLAEVLREDVRLTGTKIGCNQGDCGACSVLIEGRLVSSCLTLAVEAHERPITTIEGIAVDPNTLHPIQESFLEKGAVQCGFCSPGMILSSQSLLTANPDPTEAEIRRALSGNLCRCTGYTKIIDAIQTAASRIKSGEKS